MQRFNSFFIGLIFFALVAASSAAETFQLTDGQSVTGDLVSFDRKGIVFRTAEGQYSEPVAWEKFSQDDLKKISEKYSKAAPFAEPLIELTIEEKRAKTAIELKPVPRLQRPAAGSLVGSLFSSGIGITILLLLYAANLYAAYEVAIFRAQPPAMVCGIAAVVPIIGQIIFLCMPTHVQKFEDEWEGVEAEIAPESLESGAEFVTTEENGAPVETAAAPAPLIKETFSRGQFTFNRRFFETRFPGFFGVVRRDAEKDLMLTIKAARGMFVAQRITRIAANDIHFQVQKGPASEEVTIPFVEIQEVELKHKNAL